MNRPSPSHSCSSGVAMGPRGPHDPVQLQLGLVADVLVDHLQDGPQPVRGLAEDHVELLREQLVLARVVDHGLPGHLGVARLGPARPRRRPRRRARAAAKEAGGDGVEIMIDAGPRLRRRRADGDRVARELEQLGVFWLEEPFVPDEYEAYAELADTVDIRDRRRRAGRDALGLPRADRARPRRPRPARRHALRRHHRDAADRGARRASTACRRSRTRGRAGSSRPRRCT